MEEKTPHVHDVQRVHDGRDAQLGASHSSVEQEAARAPAGQLSCLVASSATAMASN